MENNWLQIPEECPWRRPDSQVSARIADELKKELAFGHPLFERLPQLKVVATCDANDDVLVTSSNDKSMLFCVHLTWSGKPENHAVSSPSFVPIAVGALEEFFLSYL